MNANSHLPLVFQQALAPFAPPATRPFRVELKRGSLVQESFEVQGTDSMAVAAEFRALVSPGQILKITALPTDDDLIGADLELSKDKAQRRARFEQEQARRLDLQARNCGLLR